MGEHYLTMKLQVHSNVQNYLMKDIQMSRKILVKNVKSVLQVMW